MKSMNSSGKLLFQPHNPYMDEKLRAWLERFESSPLLVFWETTKACPLACRHCRAMAIPNRLPGELTTHEGFKLIEDVASFGVPKPLLILTGGDPLCRPDLLKFISKAGELGVPVAVSPAVSPNLTIGVLSELKNHNVKMISISLDGAAPETHEYIRQVNGSFKATVEAIKSSVELGLRVQVNTVVWSRNLLELPRIAALLRRLGVTVWEVFFLIITGRAAAELDILPEEYEAVLQFLLDVSARGLQVRTVEAPFFRRLKIEGRALLSQDYSHLYKLLSRETELLLGPPKQHDVDRAFIPTRDGNGVIFVAYNGDVYPSGFLPVNLGNVRKKSLVEIYRNHPLLLSMRKGMFKGRCGICRYRLVCGGSRARAFSSTGDLLESDPACVYNPFISESSGAGEKAVKGTEIL